ncbi:MAG: riboflavin synthase [Rhodospirillales bacterium]|nr:riboflavin synthase [Rhodospirillales bacterium]
MFTGIVSDIGTVRALERPGDLRLTIATAYDPASIALGASIACSGVCLTVIAVAAETFTVSASAETLACTTLGDWRVGQRVNLERALRVGDELGGHFVFGHVDAVATVHSVAPEGESRRIVFEAPAALARYFAPKGSVALDGVSLTINEVEGARFGVNLIPHTLTATTFGEARPGDRVNLEIDMLARYVARLFEKP